jgi:hypothetical protein
LSELTTKLSSCFISLWSECTGWDTVYILCDINNRIFVLGDSNSSNISLVGMHFVGSCKITCILQVSNYFNCYIK